MNLNKHLFIKGPQSSVSATGVKSNVGKWLWVNRSLYVFAGFGIVMFLLVVLGVALIAISMQFDDESENLAALADRMQIEISVPTEPFSTRTSNGAFVQGSSADARAVDRFSLLLKEELYFYSPAILAKAGVRRFVLCTNLRYDDRAYDGFPIFDSQTVYLEIVQGMHDSAGKRKGIHHEIFHMIDFRDDGLEDVEWKKLNVSGFCYLSGGGAAMQEDTFARMPFTGSKGFLNRYSMSAVEEDKAEIFAALMFNPLALNERCKADLVVRRKVGFIKALCRSFSHDMNESFWLRAERGY